MSKAEKSDFPAISHRRLTTLQLNLGYLCNQICTHCHVNAGPARKELMSRETIDQVLAFIQRSTIATLDLTGGAPEMNPHFEYLVEAARQLDITVIDRCNLTILEEPGYEHLAQFLADQQVEITASLPCYLKENVDHQRGDGVFAKSIHALQTLNRLGYGHPGTGLKVSLAYNPQGATLPPSQAELQQSYQNHLRVQYGIVFSQLLCLTNVPIQRFRSELKRSDKLDDYLALLRTNHQPQNLESVMCRQLISVDWQGYLYDCDFNQMLDLKLSTNSGSPLHIGELDETQITDRTILVDDHCYACTAGQGSSCSGALEG